MKWRPVVAVACFAVAYFCLAVWMITQIEDQARVDMLMAGASVAKGN
jgi:hypothetical protein